MHSYVISMCCCKVHLFLDLTRSQTFDEGDDDVFVDKATAKVIQSPSSEAHPAQPRPPSQPRSVSYLLCITSWKDLFI